MTDEEIIDKVLKLQKKQNLFDLKNKIDPLYSIKIGSHYDSKQMYGDVEELIDAVAKISAQKALSMKDEQKDIKDERLLAHLHTFVNKFEEELRQKILTMEEKK